MELQERVPTKVDLVLDWELRLTETHLTEEEVEVLEEVWPIKLGDTPSDAPAPIFDSDLAQLGAMRERLSQTESRDDPVLDLIDRLVDTVAPQATTLVLVGSSMGGYVAARACQRLRPQALFLMAPALYFPGWDEEPEHLPADNHCHQNNSRRRRL